MGSNSKRALRLLVIISLALGVGVAVAQAEDQPPPVESTPVAADTTTEDDDVGVQAAAPDWAVVSSAGALVRSVGATAAASLGTGTYQVTFASNKAGCAYIATSGDPGAGAVAGPIIPTVATRAGNPNALFIQTFDQTTGALSNQPFHVVTICGAKDRFAVVDENGILARGGATVVSTARLAIGAYEVIFSKSVAKCSFTGTIGTTGTGSVPSPGQLTVAGRSGNKAGVFVRIVDRSGNSLDSPFHLGVTCGKTKLYAVVATTDTTATLARGHNVVSVAKLSGPGGGTYEVIFNRTVSGCAYTASVGTTTQGGSISTPVAITTATRAGNANGVFIFIHHTNGSTIDEPFHLTVKC
jgi:hypothetical protein